MHKELQSVLSNIKKSVDDTLTHPNAPYDFHRDNINGALCEQLSELLYRSAGATVIRDNVLQKDFEVIHPNGNRKGLEVKGDYKSVVFGNIFLEFMNTRKDEHSGIMCGNTDCLWHHYYFTKGDTSKLHLLYTDKGTLRDLVLQYKDTAHFAPKTIANARGYAITQTFFSEQLINTPFENNIKIITFDLVV